MTFENIHNYYEKLVLQKVLELADQSSIDNFVEDVACVALNKLPPRYVRYDIDMAFYLTEDERETMTNNIETAVTYAIEYVSAHRNRAA